MKGQLGLLILAKVSFAHRKYWWLRHQCPPPVLPAVSSLSLVVGPRHRRPHMSLPNGSVASAVPSAHMASGY